MNKPRNITQKIIAREQSSISDVSQSITIPEPQQRIYFDMELFEASRSNERLQTIKHGKSYHLVLSTNQDGYPGRYSEQQSLLIESDVQLQLLCPEASIKIIEDTSVQGQIQGNRKSAKHKSCIMHLKSAPWSKKFTIKFDGNCPTRDVTLELCYYQQGMPHYKPATSLKVRLEGTYDPEDEELIQDLEADLKKKLPKHIAVLHFIKQNDIFHLIGFDNRGIQVSCDSKGWETISLASLLERRDLSHEFVDPESYIGRIHQFSSQGQEKLYKWINTLSEKHNQQFCIIIADYTDLETPWEMLEIKRGKYLGAVAAVIRWVSKKYFDKDIFQLQDVMQQGSVISYLDDTNLDTKQIYHETNVLNELNTKKYNSIEELKQVLQRSGTLDGVGLIYLGCHGARGQTLGSQQDLINFYALEISGEHSEPRPIFFANACDSARLIKESGSFKGLVITALTHFASGYIGALGPVGSSYAPQIAERLLRIACTYPNGIQVAEVLRQLREEVVTKFLEDKSKKETHYSFLYTFMYVYYGNPLVRLYLGKARETEGEGT